MAFRKTCPVLCDYVYNATSQGTDPQCRAATTPEYLTQPTYEGCGDMPWCTSEVYEYCDTGRSECKTLYSTAECEAEPLCDPATPTCDNADCEVTTYVWCDAVLGCQSTADEGECESNPACDPTNPTQQCDPTTCVAQKYYTCDEASFTCQPAVGPLPANNTSSFNTTGDCAAACVDADLSGAWRAIQISGAFQGGEWDFKITSTAIAWASPESGTETTTGTYVIGDPIGASSAGYTAAAITVTLSSGEVLEGVVSNDRADPTSLGPVTKFLYLALPGAVNAGAQQADALASFPAGMAASEWVLVACLGNGIEQGCDFSGVSSCVD